MQRALNLALGAGISPLHQWKPRSLSSLPRFAAALPRHRRSSLSVSSPSSSPSPDPSSRQFLVRSPPALCPRSGAGCRAIRMSATGSESHADAAAAPAVVAPVAYKSKISFCQSCGGPTKQVVPDGDEKVRAVCTNCGNIHYENPKLVVGCLVEHSNKVLLCKRSIEPSYGLWTLPAGYLEIGESAAEGAIRETLEEASADVEVLSPFAQLDIPRIGQSYIIFRAKLNTPHFSPGPESSECALFDLDEIPFASLAFSSIFVTLKLYIEDIKSGNLNFHYCTINKRPGASPSDPKGFSVDHQLHC